MNATPPEILLETRRFRVVRHRRLLPSGQTHSRETIEHPGAVVILPIITSGSPGDEQVVLIRNFRVAVGQRLLELPAGTREPNEPNDVTAGRELIEETGYRAGRLELLREFYVSPGILSERMFLYLATELTPGDSALELGEEIEVEVLPFDRALALVDQGEIIDAKTIVGLWHYDRLRRKG